MPLPPGAPVVEWGIDGKYFIVGIGEGSADGIVAREKGAAPKWLEAIRSRLQVERPAMVHYLNIKKIISLVQAAGGLRRGAPPQLFDALGISNLNVAGQHERFGRERLDEQHAARDGRAADPAFSLSAGGKPLTAADLAPIPKDATFAVRRLASISITCIVAFPASPAKSSPRARLEMEQGIAMLENHLGIDLSQDIFKALGDTWCVYSAPSEGGLFVTGLTVVAPIRDRERLVKAEERLRSMAKAGMRSAGTRIMPIRRAVRGDDRRFRIPRPADSFSELHRRADSGGAGMVHHRQRIDRLALAANDQGSSLARAKAGSLADVPAVGELLRGRQVARPTSSYTDSATSVRTLVSAVAIRRSRPLPRNCNAKGSSSTRRSFRRPRRSCRI